MVAGRFNEPVEIFKEVEVIDEYNARNMEYSSLFKTRANVEYNSGNRGTENSEIVFNYAKRFTLRSYVPITETCQIEWQGKRYRVLSIEKRREYNDQLVMTELINE